MTKKTEMAETMKKLRANKSPAKKLSYFQQQLQKKEQEALFQQTQE